MTKGIVYYTDNNLTGIRLRAFGGVELDPLVKKLILQSNLPIVSVSLKPIENFGKNIVLNKKPNVVTMTEQILTGLEAIDTDYVFFCEHDILYHPSHFNFTPPTNDAYYCNTNTWKWDYNSDRVVTHDIETSLFICASREKLLNHYRIRLRTIYERGCDKMISRNPKWLRKMGYEPGKPTKRGGIMDEKITAWKSAHPNINVRHRRTITPKKMDLADFVHKPTGYTESTVDKIWPEEDFKMLFS